MELLSTVQTAWYGLPQNKKSTACFQQELSLILLKGRDDLTTATDILDPRDKSLDWFYQKYLVDNNIAAGSRTAVVLRQVRIMPISNNN